MRTYWYIILLTTTALACQKDELNRGTPGKTSRGLREAVEPLASTKDLDILLEQIGEARVVILGEASHGTSEYFYWRSELTKRLIEEKNFNALAFDASWPAIVAYNSYVSGSPESGPLNVVLAGIEQWPRWTWANKEMKGFSEWLRTQNITTSSPV